jgi:alcohol dehydrogenase
MVRFCDSHGTSAAHSVERTNSDTARVRLDPQALTKEVTMKALVYHGPGKKRWEEVPDATIQDPTDVIVRVDTTTICGTDLHILQGDVAAVTDGRILGHEAVGTIVEVGSAVKGFSVGDRVLVPAITKCGRCEYCQRGIPSHCQTVGGIGWIFGHLIDGTQAESVRVPYADTSLYIVPEDVTDEQAIFLADSLPTGYEVGVLAGQVRPGDTVAVIGAGAVGLAAILTTGLWGASKVIAVDSNKFRLGKALEFGATDVVEVNPRTVADIIALTDGLGVDVSIEAVGYPETLLTAASVVRPGGRIANVGVHGTPLELPMQDMWIQNVTLTMGLVDTVSIPTLLKMVASGRIPSEKMGTHSFTFDQIEQAYDVFKNAAANEALKVIIQPA